MFKIKKTGNRFVKSYQHKQTNTQKAKKIKLFHGHGKIKKIIVISLASILLIFIILIFSTHFFQIKKINISQTKHIPITKIEKMAWEQSANKRWLILPQDIIFFFDSQKLSKQLHDNFQLKKLKIVKHLPDTIDINLVEKDYTLIWNEAGQFHYINNQGDIILTLDQPEENQIIIYNQGSSQLQGRKIKVSPEMIKFINDLKDRLNTEQNFKIKEFIVDDDVNTVKLKEEGGPLIFFNVKNDIDKQAVKLRALHTTLSDNYKNLHYVDLRFGDRIFYQ